MTIKELIDAAKTRQRIPSYFALSKALKVSPQAVYNWRDGTSYPTPEHAYKLAEMAGASPAKVIADVLAQSEKNPEVRRVFEQIQKYVASAAALLILSLSPGHGEAATKNFLFNSYIHYTHRRMMQLLEIIRRNLFTFNDQGEINVGRMEFSRRILSHP